MDNSTYGSYKHQGHSWSTNFLPSVFLMAWSWSYGRNGSIFKSNLTSLSQSWSRGWLGFDVLVIAVKLLVGNTWNLLRQKGRRETKFYFVKLAIHQKREHVSVNKIIPHFSKQTHPPQNVMERNSQQTSNNSRNKLSSPSMVYPLGRRHKHAKVDTYPGWDLTQKFTHSVRSSVIAQATLTRGGCATSHGGWFGGCWWCWVSCGIP